MKRCARRNRRKAADAAGSLHWPGLRSCRRSTTLWAALLAVLVGCVTRVSGAEDGSAKSAARSSGLEPVHRGPSLELLAGYGSDPVDLYGSGNTHPLGPAFGLRAKHTFPAGLGTGASITHYFGTSSSSFQLTTALLEGGWAFAVGPGAFEPFLGFGLGSSWITTELCSRTTGQCTSDTASSMGAAAAAGLAISVPASESLFFGARLQALAARDVLGVSGFVTGGVKL